MTRAIDRERKDADTDDKHNSADGFGSGHGRYPPAKRVRVTAVWPSLTGPKQSGAAA